MRLLTAAETRKFLRVDQKTLVKMIDAGDLTAFRIGTGEKAAWRISIRSLAKYSGETEKSIITFLTRDGAEVSAS